MRTMTFAKRCMKEILREFFGYGGYLREPEGAFSWQHLTFTLSLVAVMIILGIILGLKYKNKTDKDIIFIVNIMKRNICIFQPIYIRRSKSLLYIKFSRI